MRARIELRKSGLLPTQDIESEENLVNEQVAKIRKKTGLELAMDDVVQALRRGDEVCEPHSPSSLWDAYSVVTQTFDILRMRCVSYDHRFIRHVEAAVAAWKQAKKEAYEGMAQATTADTPPSTEHLDRVLSSDVPQGNTPVEKVG